MIADNPFERFPSRAYLEKYYSYVGSENAAMLRALAQFTRRFEPNLERVVEVGGGPSVVPILALCATTGLSPRAITFTDISRANLAEVERWLDDGPRGFAYDDVLEWLAREHTTTASEVVELARTGRWKLVLADLEQPPPEALHHAFDTVSSHFFAESATSDEATLVLLLERLRLLAAPGATLMLSFMRRSLGYTIDGIDFPAVPVDESTLPGLLEAAGVRLAELEILTTGVEDPPTRPGYEGMVFVGGVLA